MYNKPPGCEIGVLGNIFAIYFHNILQNGAEIVTIPHMTALLTLNGIPPQVVGSHNTIQQHALRRYVKKNEEDLYYFYQNRLPHPVRQTRPFADTVTGIMHSFTSWGASVSEEVYHVGIAFLPVKKGNTTFKVDFNFHSDQKKAYDQMKDENKLSLRLLCASSAPAHFIDLTAHNEMPKILDENRIEAESRGFNQTLFQVTIDQGGTIIIPKEWDIIVFDGNTPHLPQPAKKLNNRILMNSWYDLTLPHNWRERVKNGDVPCWKPPTDAPQP